MRKWLCALPVYNEVDFVDDVLDNVVQYVDDVLVVDDGSTDGTDTLLARRDDVTVVRHAENRGYGAALITAFEYAIDNDYDAIVTIDCDGQHQPMRIPDFIAAAADADLVSGSRYLQSFDDDNAPPEERMLINRRITQQLNRRLGLQLTDAFCGFKAYRVEALRRLKITDPGYAMPLQLWVEAALADLSIVELAVPRIYLDLARSFGGSLDHAETRLAYYNRVLEDAITSACREGRKLPRRRELCPEA
ncbi:MAG: glycosyltransferase family 2 protein [Pirellulaceae bacterium]